MKITREHIYLASLLHDIGKFYQRADEKGAARSDILSLNIKELEGEICPSYKWRYSHKHVLWTAQFFENLSSDIRKILKSNEQDNDILLRLAAAHHNPKTFYEKRNRYPVNVDK